MQSPSMKAAKMPSLREKLFAEVLPTKPKVEKQVTKKIKKATK